MTDITDIEDIIEDDLLNALDDTNINTTIASSNNILKDEIINDKKINKKSIEINSNNMNDISELIKQLLNNKTLELSIKIKDN
jgi:hypothetical protein